jgi:hypothetical protein
MRINAALIICSASTAFPFIARADDTAVFREAGTYTCGKFPNEYLAHPDVTEGIYFSWALGLLSAMNQAASQDGLKG